MSAAFAADLCVIGAGAGGLTTAAGASQLGARTVLIERARMGGDCLNVGCVPSKALLAAARQVQAAREAPAFGVHPGEPQVDFAGVMRHVREVIAALAPQDSEARFTGLGVEVIRAPARFAGPREVVAGEHRVEARRIVIATGSAPAVPDIPGLQEVPYLTNETVFDVAALPEHLIVVGAGPIGLELAQAFRRLGARVSVLEAARPLANDDPELALLLLERLAAEGVAIHAPVRIAAVERSGDGIAVNLWDQRRIQGSHLLIAAGRRANLAELDLGQAGIAVRDGALVLDQRLRTTNRRVYAVGDAAGGPQFTHVASYHAGIVIKNALFRLPAKVDYRALPWVTFTDPELAQVGMTEAQAKAAHAGDLAVLRWPFFENDRAQAERRTAGLVKVLARRNGVVLGASILGPAAGELIQSWGVAIAGGVKLKTLAGMIAPYPTLGEASKRAAGSFFLPRLFNARTRRLVRFLQRW